MWIPKGTSAEKQYTSTSTSGPQARSHPGPLGDGNEFAQFAQVAVGVRHLQDLYYDTTFSDPLTVFPSLQALAEPSHLLFGSDYPWAGEVITSLWLARLESYQGLDQQSQFALERDNALSLFPRLESRAEAIYRDEV